MTTQQLSGEELKFLCREVEDGRYLRADGRCLCPKCGKEYRGHPYWGEAPTFHLLCDGMVVKT